MLDVSRNHRWLVLATFLGSFGPLTACVGGEEERADDVEQEELGVESGTPVALSNPGFEEGKTGWGNSSAYKLSNRKHRGSKSAKVTASGEKIEQTVEVEPNTDYTLSAFLLGKSKIGVRAGSTVLGSKRVDNDSWAKALIDFNSGDAGSVRLFGVYDGGEGNFDEFSLVAKGGAGSSTGAGSNRLPADVLDLRNWHLTLPIDTSHAGNPDQIEQPELDRFKHDTFFRVNSAGDGVVFRATTDAVRTSGSGFSRSELRERQNNGADKAAWFSSRGVHTMTIEQAVTHLPEVKPHMIVGQIHDDDSIVAAFRIEGRRLVIELENGPDGNRGPTLTSSYQLGTRFKVKFEVANNRIKFYYNDDLKFTYEKTISKGYFKAGAYVQSACRGPKKVDGESCTAYGENVIYDLKVEHR